MTMQYTQKNSIMVLIAWLFPSEKQEKKSTPVGVGGGIKEKEKTKNFLSLFYMLAVQHKEKGKKSV